MPRPPYLVAHHPDHNRGRPTFLSDKQEKALAAWVRAWQEEGNCRTRSEIMAEARRRAIKAGLRPKAMERVRCARRAGTAGSASATP